MIEQIVNYLSNRYYKLKEITMLNIAICDDNRNDIKSSYNLIKEVLDEMNIKYCIKSFVVPAELLSCEVEI